MLKHLHTQTLSFNKHFPGEPGLASCHLNSPSPLNPNLHLLVKPKLSMSSLTQSRQIFFGRPLCLIPSVSHVVQRLTHSSSSLRTTCPNYLSLLFLILKLTGSNPRSSLSSSLSFLLFSLSQTSI